MKKIIVSISFLLVATLASVLILSRVNSFADRLFYAEANVSLRTIADRMNRYTDLLYATRAYIYGSEKVTQSEWQQYLTYQQVTERYQGVSSVYYLDVFSEAERSAKITALSSSEYLARPITIRPPGQRAQYALASRVFSTNDVSGAYGTDLLSLPGRTEALATASKTQRPTATQPDKLASGFYGFSISLPVAVDGQSDDYIGVSFRAEQLLTALYGDSRQFKLKVEDVTGEAILLGTRDWSDVDLKAEGTINVGGRTWKVSQGKSMARERRVIALLVPVLIYSIALLGIALLFTDPRYRRRRRTKSRKLREK